MSAASTQTTPAGWAPAQGVTSQTDSARRLLNSAAALTARLPSVTDRADKRVVVRTAVKMLVDGLQMSPVARQYNEGGSECRAS